MKKILFILFASLSIYSCSTNNDPINETNSTPKEYIVSLGLSGEITSIEDSPLTKATTTNLYGIQVYSVPSTGGVYKPYAYGLFDDISNISIKLLEGYRYKFACTMIVDGKNKIKCYYNNKYSAPFYAYDGTGVINLSISTSFVLGSYKCESLDKGDAYLAIDSKSYTHPNIDRYYGETSDYTPAENSSVSISMKRVSFGAKIITDGLTEGTLNISLDKAPTMTITYPATEVQDIFTFENHPRGLQWTQDTYTETIPVSITWEKADGAVVPLVTQDITFTRNKLTTITVKVTDSSISSGVDLSQENTEMGDGGSVIIDAGNSTDTPVNPS